jgi:hypothetical protein
MRTSITVFVATSMIISAGLSQAQSQQQPAQQPQQQQYSNSSQQPGPASPPSQLQSPQSQPASPSSSTDSSGQSGGSMSQGTSQGTSQGSSQQNDASQSQSPSATQSTSASQSQNDVLQTKLQPKTENGITYLCGGVGEEQVSQMKDSKGDYDLMLTFATRSGEYLADVDVAIKDAKGKSVLQTTCGGPILLVNLPRSGTYRVQAKAEDYSLRKTVKVKAKGPAHSVVMTWPRDPAENAGVASTGSRQEAGSSGSSESRSRSGNGSSKADDKATQQRQ